MKKITLEEFKSSKWQVCDIPSAGIEIHTDRGDSEYWEEPQICIMPWRGIEVIMQLNPIDKYNAELIVTAVNICKQINPDDPLLAAKNLTAALSANNEKWEEKIESFWNGNYGYYVIPVREWELLKSQMKEGK